MLIGIQYLYLYLYLVVFVCVFVCLYTYLLVYGLAVFLRGHSEGMEGYGRVWDLRRGVAWFLLFYLDLFDSILFNSILFYNKLTMCWKRRKQKRNK